MKKLILFIFSIFIFHCQLKANFNSKNVITGDTIKKNKVVTDTNKGKKNIPIPENTPQIVPIKESDVSVKPKFNYNGKTFNEYLEANFKIPKGYENVKFDFKVNFVVDENGKIKNVKLKDSCNHAILNNYVINFVKNQPSYLPGKKNGKKVKTQCTINIILAGNEE